MSRFTISYLALRITLLWKWGEGGGGGQFRKSSDQHAHTYRKVQKFEKKGNILHLTIWQEIFFQEG